MTETQTVTIEDEASILPGPPSSCPPSAATTPPRPTSTPDEKGLLPFPHNYLTNHHHSHPTSLRLATLEDVNRACSCCTSRGRPGRAGQAEQHIDK